MKKNIKIRKEFFLPFKIRVKKRVFGWIGGFKLVHDKSYNFSIDHVQSEKVPYTQSTDDTMPKVSFKCLSIPYQFDASFRFFIPPQRALSWTKKVQFLYSNNVTFVAPFLIQNMPLWHAASWHVRRKGASSNAQPNFWVVT